MTIFGITICRPAAHLRRDGALVVPGLLSRSYAVRGDEVTITLTPDEMRDLMATLAEHYG